jgi:hypothetical protein
MFVAEEAGSDFGASASPESFSGIEFFRSAKSGSPDPSHQRRAAKISPRAQPDGDQHHQRSRLAAKRIDDLNVLKVFDVLQVLNVF